mmetsp:Transcript_14940/g.29864  ORF Transcript_14940/g.29864 Transcript_14940/m.29864 type:complete len:244 (+) Transcript_14940:1008-1739(+)
MSGGGLRLPLRGGRQNEQPGFRRGGAAAGGDLPDRGAAAGSVCHAPAQEGGAPRAHFRAGAAHTRQETSPARPPRHCHERLQRGKRQGQQARYGPDTAPPCHHHHGPDGAAAPPRLTNPAAGHRGLHHRHLLRQGRALPLCYAGDRRPREGHLRRGCTAARLRAHQRRGRPARAGSECGPTQRRGGLPENHRPRPPPTGGHGGARPHHDEGRRQSHGPQRAPGGNVAGRLRLGGAPGTRLPRF